MSFGGSWEPKACSSFLTTVGCTWLFIFCACVCVSIRGVGEADLLKNAAAKTWWTKMEGKKLIGVPRLPRNFDVIDTAFLTELAKTDKRLPWDQRVALATQGMLCDYSQGSDRGSWGNPSKTITSKTRFYSYDEDRAIIPEEHFRMMGHPSAKFDGLSQNQVRTLAGDLMSMPCVGMITAALLLCADIPGLWFNGPNCESQG